MPKQQGLLRRGARFYSNIKVPLDLREVLGKEHIREALGTSDYKEACQKMPYERMRWQARFDEERRKLSRSGTAKRELKIITEREAYEMASRHLIHLEREFRKWYDGAGFNLSDEEREAALFNVSDEAEVHSGASPGDDAFALRSYLESEGIHCEQKSAAFQVLRPLFRAVRHEHAMRKLDVLQGHPVVARDTHFQHVFAHSELPTAPPSATVGELVTRYLKALQQAERSEATLRTYVMPCRVLREGLGEDFPLSAVGQDTMERLCDLLRNLPVNSAQRYPGLALPACVESADKAKDERRLEKRTQRNYFNVIVGIFNFAVEKRLMTENPAKDRWLKLSFGKPEKKPKAQFTIEELNRLFRAPLFVGCVDDGRGFAKSGPNRPRRGRFWVPLLGLFHGFRLNEACQLHVADMKERNGIPYLAVRVATETNSKSDKRLKTEYSERDIPLHPKLREFGFLDFVAERRKANDSPRLFPELPSGAKGYYSHPFSKWFPRFCKNALGYEPEATFHSLRHQFRDATRAARLPNESVGLLGGWEEGEGDYSLVMNHYGRGNEFFKVLAEDIAKVEFPGLDLAHLQPERPILRRTPVRDRE